jgi:chromosome partition protein MukE
MSDSRFLTLGDAVEDENFPEVDLILRRGRHIDRDDTALYGYLSDAADHLEPFYRRFGCELVHASEGYFYLLPTNDKLGRRHLGVPEMLVGQALALLYLDPSTLQNGGVVTKQDALSRLAGVTGSDALTQAFNPKRKRVDERVAEETVRAKFGEALRRLSTLGFVDLLENDGLKLRSALMRFAEPVKGEGSSLEALERLVARGELVLGTGDDEEESDGLDAEPAEREPKAPKKRAEREATPLPPAVAEAMVDFEEFGAEFHTAGAKADAPSEAPSATETVGEGERRFAELFPEGEDEDQDEDELDEDESEPDESEPDAPALESEPEPWDDEPVTEPDAPDDPAYEGEPDESEPDEPAPEGEPEPWDDEPDTEHGAPDEPGSEREGEH